VGAAGRGDYSREEGTAMVRCKVIVTEFGDLFPSPKIERTVKVLMAEDPVAILGGSIALKFMDDGDVHDEIAHFGFAYIRSKKFHVTDNSLLPVVVTRGMSWVRVEKRAS
jgi:hypothetical protein